MEMTEDKEKALTPAMTSGGQFQSMIEMAKVLLQSGFLPLSVNTPAKAVAIILTGKELGIGAMTALQSINVIQGKPTVAPALKLALAYQKIKGFKLNVVESTSDHCTVIVDREGEKKDPITFTIEDAAKLGLSDKDNWKKQPATMLRWRAIDAALRLYAIDATLGLYSPEEIDPNVKVDFNTGAIIVEELKTPLIRKVDLAPVLKTPNILEDTKEIFDPVIITHPSVQKKAENKQEKPGDPFWGWIGKDNTNFVTAKVGKHFTEEFLVSLGMKESKKKPGLFTCMVDESIWNQLDAKAKEIEEYE